jgi:alpha-tubulin suppressor-like RCC1 family protein
VGFARVGLLLTLALPLGCEEPVFPALTSDLVAVTTGGAHSCGLDSDGRAYCWGANGSGQLGIGDDLESLASPVAVAGDFRFTTLSAGLAHTCGVVVDGTVACWGSNTFGELGDGTGSRREAPVVALGLQDAVVVGAGFGFTCALDRQGLAWCWGRNSSGQLGTGVLTPARGPVSVAGGRRFHQLTLGAEHACALDVVGRAYCWGANEVGQSGLTALTDSREPARVQGELIFRQVAAGLRHTCGLDQMGVAYCWGSNEEGELGDGGIGGMRFGPARVSGAFRFTRVEPGGGPWTCGITEPGEVACWGRNDRGAFGRSGPTRLRGAVVLPLGRWGTLDAGDGHLCGLALEGGSAFCWGEGGSGQLGNGSRIDQTSPSPVGGGA